MALEERDNAIPLREYVDMRVAHEHELRNEWLKSNAELVREAKGYVTDKLEKMNEVREQILAERGQYETKLEHRAEMNALESRLRIIEGFTANLQGRLLATGGILGVLTVLIAHFWK